ncbi:MAG: hypothetical protein EBR68_05265 [Synechococcaceae bacterium WB4_2_0811]|nr:hypothetical protein [Synechococcaceae bacterium WB4_2_0811]
MSGSNNMYGRNADLAAERDAILSLPPDQQQAALMAMSQRRSSVPAMPGGFREPTADSEGGAYTEGLPPASGVFADVSRAFQPRNMAAVSGSVSEKRGEDTAAGGASSPSNPLSGLPAGMQSILSQQRELNRRAGENARGIADVEQRQRVRLAEGEEQTSRAYANTQRQLTQNLDQRMRPIPEFIPTQETARDIGTLASLLMVAGATLGGKARGGALMAVQSMTGMMNGYRQGRQDLYQRERQNFETGVRQVQAQNQQLQQAFERAQRLAQTDMEAAQRNFRLDAVRLGADLPRLAGERAGLQGELQVLQSTAQMVSQIEQRKEAERVRLATAQAQREATTAAQVAAENRRIEARREETAATNERNAGIRAQEIIDNQEPAQQERTRAILRRATNTATTAKNINDAYTVFETSEGAARIIAQYRDAVGPLGVALNRVAADPASGPLRSITNWFTGQPGDDVRGEAAMNQAIDRAVQQGAISSDMAARAKVLSKTLFSLALADAQATGRPTVFLERALAGFYSQALRDTTLLEIVHGRAEEAVRRLPDPSLRPNTRRDYNDNFSILSSMRDNRFDAEAFLNRYPQVGGTTTTPRTGTVTPGAARAPGTPAAGPAEGTIAENPQTGERRIRRNGRWEPMQ